MRHAKKFTIRYKYLAVTSLLLAGCVALYLYIAVAIFKSDKQQMVFDLNRSLVTNISSELETQFTSLSDKIELFAMAGYQKELKKEFVENLLQKNKEIVFVSFWSETDGVRKFTRSYSRDDYLKTYGIELTYFTERQFESKQLYLKDVIEQGEEVWNATLENGPPLIGYARSVSIEDEHGRPIDRVAVLAFVDASRFLKTVSEVESTQVFITSSEGEVLVHKDPHMMLQNKSIENSAVFAKAFTSPVKKEVIQARINGEDILGAFAKIFNGKLFVLAEANGRKAFAVVDDLIRRSLIFSLIVLTAAFMAAVVFSRSLTRPLETLTAAMDRVAEGDLETKTDIHTKDEIEFLSKSFNQMIDDLRQSRQELEEINRDLENKVKERTLQLEKQNQAVKEAQEALLTTTRLAAVGEIAGRAAHEVLNPLTSMMARLENVQKRLDAQEKMHIKIIDDIRTAWDSDYKNGGFALLTENWKKESTVLTGKNLWEEDAKNIETVVNTWKSEIQDLMRDSRFLLQEGERINKIVGQMRSLSVVKSSHELCNLSELLTKCHNIMADLMSKYEIEFKVDSVDSKIAIRIDADEFIQSLTNLLRNSQQAIVAVKTQQADHRGQVHVRVATSGTSVQLFIEDNGIGVNPKDQNKLFENNFSTKPKEEGTGLGLNISRRFLRAAGGEIEFIESVPGIRTVFKITLPIRQSEEVAA